MLILSRRMNSKESIVIINNDTKERIILTFKDQYGKEKETAVKICFQASSNYTIIRGEIENKGNHTSNIT